MNRNGFAPIVILLVIGLLLIAGGAWYYLAHESPSFQAQGQTAQTSQPRCSLDANGLPPDPGAAGEQTLAGIDCDHNGVRDDVERYIALTYPESTTTRVALAQIAKALEAEITDASNPALLQSDAIAWSRGADCLSYVTASSAADAAGLMTAMNEANALKAQVLNTSARIDAYYAANGELGSFSYTRPNFATLGSECEPPISTSTSKASASG